MKLYQEAGVNPLMGCLPVVLQMPLFFALFSVLGRLRSGSQPLAVQPDDRFVTNVDKSDDLRRRVKDSSCTATSLHVHIVVAFVVLVSMATTYLTVRQSMKRGMSDRL